MLHVVNYSTAGPGTYDAMVRAATDFAVEQGVAYRETNNRIKKGSEAELAKILSLYAASDIILSSALHGCIIGVAMGRKVLAVSGDRKIDAFMSAVGLQDWVLDYTEVHLVSDRLEKLAAQRSADALLADMRSRNERLAETIRSHHTAGQPVVLPPSLPFE